MSCFTGATQPGGVVLAVVFDIREAQVKDPKFITLAQGLYEVSLLSHSALIAGGSSKPSHLSLLLVGSKGHEVLLDIHPLTRFDQALKRIFAKLRQLLSYPNQDAIYSFNGSFECITSDLVSRFKEKCVVMETAELEIVIVTVREEAQVLKEAESLIYRINNILPDHFHYSLNVVHLSPSGQFDATMKQDAGKKVVWHSLTERSDVSDFFRRHLAVNQRKSWKLRIDGHVDWSVEIDIEDLAIDFPVWPTRRSNPSLNGASKLHTYPDTVVTGAANKILEICEFVVGDGLPLYLMHGPPRVIYPSLPADKRDATSDCNRTRFLSMWNWLRVEGLIAIVRLSLMDRLIDYFVICPGSEGRLLMRNIVPAELFRSPDPLPLPAAVNQRTTRERSLLEPDTIKEICSNEMQKACSQIGIHAGWPSARQHEDGSPILKFLEENILQAQVGPFGFLNSDRR